MDADVKALRDSFRQLVPKAEKLAQTFYETLFERYPETLPLFTGVRFDEQKRKLIRSLALIVRNVDRPEFLKAYLQGLGAIHSAYGVKAEHYPAVGECLIAALAATAGNSWTAAEEAAWRAAYRMIAETMNQGAAQFA